MKVVFGIVLAGGLLMGQEVVTEKRIEIIRSQPSAAADVLMWRGGVPGAPLGPQTFEFVSAEGFGPAQAVKGAPYAADTAVESVQTLADGNRIVNKNVSSFARDSEGRTRREIHVEVAGKPEESHKVILIDDPVAGVHYVLNTRTKTATKGELPKEGGMRPPMGPPPMGGVITGAATRIIRAEGTAPVTEELGKQTMEGVEVTGRRVTITVPAGGMGNERALVSKTETWFSESLKAPVLVKRSDPRMGETTSRTTNIRQVEQPRYLFEVPADYKVEEMKPRIFRFDRKEDEL
jgi:hypothetical protein